MKVYIKLLILLISFPQSYIFSQTFLTEDFESGIFPPTGWSEETVFGNEPWRFRNGGHSPNDPNWELPPDSLDIRRNPPSAYEGTYNAIFFKQSNNNERTKLITKELNLLGATAPELSFYHCQVEWAWTGEPVWDQLRVYYKVAPGSSWVLLHEYLDAVNDWEKQTLNLPNPSETYYVAFEGHTRWGFGTCLDSISIVETEATPLYIGEISFEQPLSTHTPSGNQDLSIMQVELKVFGNTDSLILDQIAFTSLNTSDSDIESGGVKLYSTTTKTFEKTNPLGSPVSFNGGIATFSGLNHSLPAGKSYLWLTYDVAQNATHGDTLDVMVEANAISAGGLQYPSSYQSPTGHKIIYKTLYHTGFEGTHNWNLTGEFEVDIPSGGGGSPGNPNPDH